MSSLEEILFTFQELDPEDRLEWLIQYGNSLSPLNPEYRSERDAGLHIVHECQAPVFLKPVIVDDVIQIHADVPREAPIARGFVSLLKVGFDGAAKERLAEGPADMLEALGIKTLLGMQRQRGLSAIYGKLKSAYPLPS